MLYKIIGIVEYIFAILMGYSQNLNTLRFCHAWIESEAGPKYTVGTIFSNFMYRKSNEISLLFSCDIKNNF